MKERDTPLRLARLWLKLLPGCYEQLDYMAAAKADGEIWWPDYCPLPISAAYTYILDSNGQDKQNAAACAAELTACWIWRQDKIVYTFDPDLTDALAGQVDDMEDTDVLPTDLLLHMPYPCVYIKAPTLIDHADGFFAWVEWDVNRKAPELRVQLVLEDMAHSVPLVLHLLPGATLGECIADTLRTSLGHLDGPAPMPKAGVQGARPLLAAIQHILYLNAANADVTDEPTPLRPDPRPRQTPTEGVVRVIRDKAGEVAAKQVGIRVGAALRAARTRPAGQSGSGGSGARKRSHTRRGHWHHYWTGPLDGIRELVLKWSAPTVIHLDEGRPDNVTIYPVK